MVSKITHAVKTLLLCAVALFVFSGAGCALLFGQQGWTQEEKIAYDSHWNCAWTIGATGELVKQCD